MFPTLISLVALAISTFSYFVAPERFRLDLHNKRFDIYVRTVKFYQALLSSEVGMADGRSFVALRADFIIAVKESRFLFSPESGVYDLLNRLNSASITITGSRDLPKGLPPETIIQNQKKFSEALILWNSSIETLEDLMAPYLNYHYASAPSALVGTAKSWCHRLSPRRNL
jgi:hypothetical protein